MYTDDGLAHIKINLRRKYEKMWEA